MQQEFPHEKYPFIRYFIGEVRDRDRLELALNDVDFVVHAAALKQVTTAEYNSFECIRINVFGAENVVSACLLRGVKRVVACPPTRPPTPSTSGASKLASDKIFVAANNLAGADGPHFSVVRYGNVFGSRGSVVLPFFKKLIADGVESLPITDERMTSFWITLTHGVNFVLSSMEMMRGGEIYVPKIPSSTIPRLATLVSPTHKQHVVHPSRREIARDHDPG
jgi:UDP-N-acetylglucosamine 4,6-dehydratase